MPTILCHQVLVADDRIVDYRLRMADQKRHAVEAFRALRYRVVAAGDSYNDAAMLGAAHVGIWFHAPAAIAAQFPDHAACDDYDELLALITAALRP
jgi:phosphoserine/homoserine phosphotransferase